MKPRPTNKEQAHRRNFSDLGIDAYLMGLLFLLLVGFLAYQFLTRAG